MNADAELRHGYTLADVHQMTAAALRADRSMAMGYADRRDIAWSAIVETLYAAPHWPRRESLIQAGWQAIYQEVKDSRHHHGYANREWDTGLGSAPRFAAYWAPQVTPSHEDRIVERLATPAIVATLSPAQREAVLALAAYDGDRGAAAAALGLALRTFNMRLQGARRACIALWLEHETPHRTLARPDVRRHRSPVLPCGTYAAARRHRTRGEKPCELCAPAAAAYDRERKGRLGA